MEIEFSTDFSDTPTLPGVVTEIVITVPEYEHCPIPNRVYEEPAKSKADYKRGFRKTIITEVK